MTQQDYRTENYTCEVLPHIIRVSPGTAAEILAPWGVGIYACRRAPLAAREIHHIGYGGRNKHEAVWNWIHVCQPVHNWFHGHCPKLANQCISLWVKHRKQETDWEAMTAACGEQWPGMLELDRCRTMCQRVGQWCDDWRLELINGGN